MAIRLLPRQLIDQIAAGEVVERPASAVKELVENALDAGAKRITVEIEGGGADRLAVIDDGAGIPADQLPLAVASHATSKIASMQELARVATLGFRGEALASIGSVSRLTITSRTADAEHGARIAVDGGTVGQVAPAARPTGTTVEVRQLFHNVPARRRFLKGVATEAGRVQEAVEAIAVCRPGVAFLLLSDGKARLDLPATGDPRTRALAVLGPSVAEAMLEVSGEAPTEGGGMLTIWGMAGTPAVARSSGRALRFALNGRAVQDRTLLHAVKEAYRGLLDPGRTPLAFIAIEMDPALVDVNVHPAKTEVRFRHSSLVHTAVQRAVKDALRAADLVPAFALAHHQHTVRMQVLPTPTGAAPRAIPSIVEVAPAAQAPVALATAALAPAVLAPAALAPAAQAPPLVDNRPAHRVLQVHGSYLVVEDEHGILIIDQHALHERAMFEEFHRRVTGGDTGNARALRTAALESQRTLIPLAVTVEPRAAEALDGLQPLLARLGIEATAAGPRSVAIHAFPTFFTSRRVVPQAFLAELLERAADDGIPQDPEAALHTVLDMMACKAAVKAGDHLNATELAALLDARERIERSTSCPHGRPTTLRITIRDLERQFGRA